MATGADATADATGADVAVLNLSYNAQRKAYRGTVCPGDADTWPENGPWLELGTCAHWGATLPAAARLLARPAGKDTAAAGRALRIRVGLYNKVVDEMVGSVLYTTPSGGSVTVTEVVYYPGAAYDAAVSRGSGGPDDGRVRSIIVGPVNCMIRGTATFDWDGAPGGQVTSPTAISPAEQMCAEARMREFAWLRVFSKLDRACPTSEPVPAPGDVERFLADIVGSPTSSGILRTSPTSMGTPTALGPAPPPELWGLSP